ncbi:MAG: hypothetical protein LBG86_01055 [Puniceicoccales bacterium]|jgi:heme/copper-type cytochrome/quinol oxidase subunit 2|nr:hypothetical protein [Puniceicoccales bacterium]
MEQMADTENIAMKPLPRANTASMAVCAEKMVSSKTPKTREVTMEIINAIINVTMAIVFVIVLLVNVCATAIMQRNSMVAPQGTAKATSMSRVTKDGRNNAHTVATTIPTTAVMSIVVLGEELLNNRPHHRIATKGIIIPSTTEEAMGRKAQLVDTEKNTDLHTNTPAAAISSE